jgi:glyoxylase-like metal-dependent hydrolase (beta-lactamase superfamily II)
MTQVTEGIYFIEGRDDMIPDSHIYIIGKPETNDLTMVDTGLVGKADYKLNAVEQLGLQLSDIKRVIMTHTHLDHLSCFPEIKDSIPDIELWVHTLEAGPLETGDERAVYGMDVFKGMCQAQYNLTDGFFHFNVDRKLNNAELLELGGMLWEVLHIPGHSSGSIALYSKEMKALIPGDVVYADYAIGRFDLHGADPAQHMDSLNRLAELEVDILLPGHNRIMTSVPEGYIRATAEQWESYLV